MAFKQGKIVDSFSVKVKDGKEIEVVFRYPKKSDLKAVLKLVNSVRNESDYLGHRKTETLKSEREWLKKTLSNMKKKNGFVLFVEVESKLVGDASIQPYQYESGAHIGTFGIMLKENLTGLGIGSRLGKRILELAKKETNYKIIESGYFAKNRRSARLHKRLGFKECGRLQKGSMLKNGKFDDTIWLYKTIRRI